MGREISHIIIFDLTDTGTACLYDECRELLHVLVTTHGITSLKTTEIVPDGKIRFRAEWDILHDHLVSQSPFDPNSAPDVMPWPYIYLAYTGAIPYTHPGLYVYGSGALHAAYLRYQHRDAVWHETCHALGVRDNCPRSCLMNWHVPITTLCPWCLDHVGDVPADREAYINDLQGRGVHDLDAVRKDIVEREDRVLKDALEHIVRRRGSKDQESGSSR